MFVFIFYKYFMEIVYASETGTAFDIALQFYSEYQSENTHFSSFQELQEFKADHIYIFFIATTGQGDFPYEMRSFWKKMMSKNYTIDNNIHFAIYGLGDRSYGDSFNMAGRKLKQRLLMLEAKQLVQIGLGDDQDPQGYKEMYEKQWFPSLMQKLEKLKIKKCKDKMIKNDKNIKLQLRERVQDTMSRYEITRCKGLSDAQRHNVYWVTIKIDEKYDIKCGDILNIYPHNGRDKVQKLFQYFTFNNLNDLEWEEEKLFEYLQSVSNLHNYVNRSFFCPELPSYISTNIDVSLRKVLSEKLKQLSNDYSEYYNYIKRYRRNVHQVITDFNLQIPLSVFTRIIGMIFPRKYSIAKINDNNTICVLVKLEEYEVNKNRIYRGLCTTDLINKKQENRVRYGSIVTNGQLQFIPQDINYLILVSLGTGIAPFLSILYRALEHKDKKWNIMLFHSARTHKQTYIQDNLVQALSQSNMMTLHLSLTREKHKQKTKYKNVHYHYDKRIQFVFEENVQEIVNFINEHKDYKVMVCGPKEVKTQIQGTLVNRVGLEIRKLKKKRQFCFQNW